MAAPPVPVLLASLSSWVQFALRTALPIICPDRSQIVNSLQQQIGWLNG